MRRASNSDWQHLALWVAKDYASRPDIEDIRQEALIGAWRSTQRVDTSRGCSLNQAAVKGARWAVCEYLRQQPGGMRCRRVQEVSLDELLTDDRWDVEPRQLDFAAEALERLHCWSRARQVLTEEQYDILRRRCFLQQDRAEIAQARGCSPERIDRQLVHAQKRLRPELERTNHG